MTEQLNSSDAAASTEQAGLYVERQRVTSAWIWVIVLAATGFAWWAFVQQIVFHAPLGNQPAPDWAVWGLFLILGLGLPTLIASMSLRVIVSRDFVDVWLFPIVWQRLEIADIRSCTAREYRPLREYGGWGLRWSPNGIAYSLRGNQGVQLELSSGKRILIGSQHADELADAIKRQRRWQTSTTLNHPTNG